MITCIPEVRAQGTCMELNVTYANDMYLAELTIGAPSYGKPVQTQSWDVKYESNRTLSEILVEGKDFLLRINAATGLGALRMISDGQATLIRNLQCETPRAHFE
jgi:hypothetical protein